MSKILERKTVKRVRAALLAGGAKDTVIELADTARSAADAAKALKVPQGAIVKSLVFVIGDQPVLVLVAGDRVCLKDVLPRTFFLNGKVTRPRAEKVQKLSGFSIGGVAPLGLIQPMAVVMDVSLKRFPNIYAAAGHPRAIFKTDPLALRKLTGATFSYAVAAAP